VRGRGGWVSGGTFSPLRPCRVLRLIHPIMLLWVRPLRILKECEGRYKREMDDKMGKVVCSLP
jgi:hypothetical protein